MKNLQKRVGKGQLYLSPGVQVLTSEGITSTMLSSMKGVKMAGLTEKFAAIIQNLRVVEMLSATRFRMMMVYTVAVGKFLSHSDNW